MVAPIARFRFHSYVCASDLGLRRRQLRNKKEEEEEEECHPDFSLSLALARSLARSRECDAVP